MGKRIAPHPITAFGETKLAIEWSKDRRCKVKYTTLLMRLNLCGWQPEEAITCPSRDLNIRRLVGRQYKYFVVERTLREDGKPMAYCRCCCGNRFAVPTYRISQRQSCGCIRTQNARKATTIHGYHKHPLYDVWHGMNSRCNDLSDINYGGRGICVDPVWRIGQPNQQGLLNFLQWEKEHPKPSNKHSLDRIDNDGPYSPSNCRWSTHSAQLKNRRGGTYYRQIITKQDAEIARLKKKIAKLER